MKTGLLLLLLFFVSFQSFAQKEAIERVWLNSAQTAKIQVYKAVDGKFYGKVIFLTVPNDEHGIPKLDTKNHDTQLQKQPIINLVILKDFTKSKDDANVYEDGTIYDPNTGKTYCGKLTVKGKELILRGSICGLSWLFGRSTAWTLVE